MIHHRTPEFSRTLASLLEGLGPVFGTRQPILPVHTTGRGALEATICNLFSAGDEIAVCCNGKFGEMWAGFAASYGLVVHRIATDWTRNVDPLEIDRALDAHRQIRAVAAAYCDTSTGVQNDVQGIAAAARRRGILSLVDGVSALGGMPFAFDDWGVDVAVTASQKCLMASPGLAFATLSGRAWHATGRATLPRNYWDFAAIRHEVAKAKPETPGTPPVHIVLQLAESVAMIHEEGLQRVFQRHEAMAALARQRATELGLKSPCPALTRTSPTLTPIALPPGLSPKVVRDGLKARGILTAAGLGTFEPTAFRIGHMGDIRVSDVDRTMDALRDVLVEVSTSAGEGARAARS
jgi:aspartate aminotransferase-like enzyme